MGQEALASCLMKAIKAAAAFSASPAAPVAVAEAAAVVAAAAAAVTMRRQFHLPRPSQTGEGGPTAAASLLWRTKAHKVRALAVDFPPLTTRTTCWKKSESNAMIAVGRRRLPASRVLVMASARAFPGTAEVVARERWGVIEVGIRSTQAYRTARHAGLISSRGPSGQEAGVAASTTVGV